jgi:hypothetical protein
MKTRIALLLLLIGLSGAAISSDGWKGKWLWISGIGPCRLEIARVEGDIVHGIYLPEELPQHRSDFWSQDGSEAKLIEGRLHITLKSGSVFVLNLEGHELSGIFTRNGEDTQVVFARVE